MSAGLAGFLLVGAFLVGAGAFVVARRASLAAGLAGVPLLLGGAAVDLAAVARFATGSHDQLSGQEFAVLATGFALALVAVGSRLAATETAR